jgi:hypothetical protein
VIAALVEDKEKKQTQSKMTVLGKKPLGHLLKANTITMAWVS